MEQLSTENLIDIPKQLEDNLGWKPTVIYLVSPGIAAGKNHDFKSPSMLEGEYFRGKSTGYIGGILRVWAVAYLHKYFPEAKIVTSSKIEGISHAEVQERELLNIWEKWNIPSPEQIIKEEKSTNTMTEMEELVHLIVDNGWRGNIVAVTNDYHVPRVIKTLDCLPSLILPNDPSFEDIWERFKNMVGVNLSVKDAESILSTVSPKFEKTLQEAFEKEPLKSYRKLRIELEARGLRALEEGTYKAQPLKI